MNSISQNTTGNRSLTHDIAPAAKYLNLVMPDLIRHPAAALDAGLRRNDEREVFNCRSKTMARKRRIKTWLAVMAAVSCLLVLSGCPLLQLQSAPPRATAEMQRDQANLAAAHEAFRDGEYPKARALFTAIQHAQDADLVRHALYGLACTQLVAARTPREYKQGLKLWAHWTEFLASDIRGEDPRLLAELLPRSVPKDPSAAAAPSKEKSSRAAAQAQKLIQAQRRQTEVLEAKIALLEKEVRVLNYFEEYSRNLETEVQTLRHQIQTLQAIDQNIQQKQQEISSQ